jgi:hypothetical protein
MMMLDGLKLLMIIIMEIDKKFNGQPYNLLLIPLSLNFILTHLINLVLSKWHFCIDGGTMQIKLKEIE